jgi:hypothetical protein
MILRCSFWGFLGDRNFPTNQYRINVCLRGRESRVRARRRDIYPLIIEYKVIYSGSIWLSYS